MSLVENLKRIEQVQEEIKQKYIEIDHLKKAVVKEMLESGNKDITLENGLHETLVWVVEKKIDYDKLQKQYEDIYILGLRPSFSRTQALNCISLPLLNKVLKDCTITEMGYQLKEKKGD
jgi:glutamate racemase